MENNNREFAQQQIGLSLSLASVNKILAALGNLPYTQVYELIQDIRQQTETQVLANNPGLKSENQQNEPRS